MPKLRIHMLGEFTIWRDETLIAPQDWPTQKSQSLLKILLTERTGSGWVAADRIMEYLWPDLGLKSAQNNLWVSVSQARRILEPGLPRGSASIFILNGPQGYKFNSTSDTWLDVDAFNSQVKLALSAPAASRRLQALEEARQLYTGAFLPDNLYDDWAAPAREKLQEAYLTLLDELAEAYARKNNFAQAAVLATESLSVDRARELTYRRLMVYHAAMGDPARALQIFQACRDILMDELGTEPSTETLALQRQIERREGAAVQPAPVIPALPIEPSHLTNFVGREKEFALLTGCVNQLISRQGQVVLIEGEPGIGKSRLVAETLRYAQKRQVLTLMACCYQIEQSTPFQPIIDLILRVLHTAPDQPFKDLPQPALVEIAALVPEAGANTISPLPNSAGLDETRLARLLNALSLFFHSLGKENGLVLVIDDLHWSDNATIKALHYLARSIAGQPVLLVCTYRVEELNNNEDLSYFVEDMRREAHTQLVHLEPLNAQDIAVLLEATGVMRERKAELAEWFQRETEGNPFFLVTILQSLMEQNLPAADENSAHLFQRQATDLALTLPEALREYVRSRLRRVPRQVRGVLETAAVLRRRFEFATLQAVSGQEARELLPALEDLLARHLLREVEDGRHYDFYHDKIREVVYLDMTSARRTFLHGEIARFLEGHNERFIDENAGTLAEHLEQTQNWPKAIRYLCRAGMRSRRLFGIHEAIHFYDRAIALAEEHPEALDSANQIELHERRGEAGVQAGDFERAAGDLEIALQHARQSRQGDRERGLLISLGMLHRRSDHYAEARVYLEQALAISRASGDQRDVADALYHLGTVVWSQGDNNRATMYHLEAVEISKTLGLRDLVAAQAIHGLGEAAWFSAQYLLAVRYFNESIEIATEVGDKGLIDENLHNLGVIYAGMMGADYQKALEVLQTALEITREVRLSWHMMPSLFILSLAMAGVGDYEQGLAFAAEAMEIAEQANSHRYLTVALDYQGMLFQDLNLYAQAEQSHARGLELARATGVNFWLPVLQANLAIVRVKQGRLDVGEDLHQALAFSEENGLEMHALRCLEGLALWSLASRRPDEALTYALKLEAISTPQGLREILTQALRLKSEAFRALGQLDDAQEAIEHALKLAEKIAKPRVLWDVHASAEAVKSEQGDAQAAAAHRATVREIVHQLAENLSDPAMRAGLPVD